MHREKGDVLDNFFCHPMLNATTTCKFRTEKQLQPESSNIGPMSEGLYDEIAVAAHHAG